LTAKGEILTEPGGENLLVERDFLYICKELKAVPNAFGIAFSFIAAGGRRLAESQTRA
jgi:hypothetical protein